MQHLFVLGDSISIHYGPYLQAYTESQFSYARKTGGESAIQEAKLPTGNNGGDSSMVLAYLSAMTQANALQADVLLLNCGLHDIKRYAGADAPQVGIVAYEENLRQIAAIARQAARQTVWVRTTPVDEAMHNAGRDFYRYNADIDAYNAIADRIMGAAGAKIIDLNTFTSQLAIHPLHVDGVHYGEEVQRLQGAYIAGYLAGMG